MYDIAHPGEFGPLDDSDDLERHLYEEYLAECEEEGEEPVPYREWFRTDAAEAVVRFRLG